MLRRDVQHQTGLTRKSLDYYEKLGIVIPKKSANGYRHYSQQDLEILKQVSLYRKLGMSLSEIQEVLAAGVQNLASILRKKQHQSDIDDKRKEVLELIIKGEKQKVINEKVALMEKQETIYEKLGKAFPGYFGQMLFAAYQPFLNEPIRAGSEEAYKEFVNYLDGLPTFDLTQQEQAYIEDISSPFDMHKLKEMHADKMNAIKNSQKWLMNNNNSIKEYEAFKSSDEYLKSPMKIIQDKLQDFMLDNKYYEMAIPLLRKFSQSYDEYYQKLLEANANYINAKQKL